MALGVNPMCADCFNDKELDTTGGLAAEADKFIARAVEKSYQ